MKRIFLENIKTNEDSFDNAIDEITTEFWIYLATRGEKLDTELSQFIYLRDWDKLKRKMTSMFYYYLKEQKRDTYYRHIRQVLTEYSECYCQPQHGYTAYAFTESVNLHPLENDFQSLPPYASWPHPETSTQEINTKAGIIKASRFFWEQVRKRLGYEGLVPVRELLRYLHSQYNLNEIFISTLTESDLSNPSDTGEKQNKDSENILEHLAQDKSLKSNSTRQPVPYSKDRLKELAHKMVSRFSEEQFKLFCMKYFREWNMKTIASKLGYKGESGVAYQLNKVHAKIRQFCSMWPGISPPDYEETLFLDFFDQLVSFCH